MIITDRARVIGTPFGRVATGASSSARELFDERRVDFFLVALFELFGFGVLSAVSSSGGVGTPVGRIFSAAKPRSLIHAIAKTLQSRKIDQRFRNITGELAIAQPRAQPSYPWVNVTSFCRARSARFRILPEHLQMQSCRRYWSCVVRPSADNPLLTTGARTPQCCRLRKRDE